MTPDVADERPVKRRARGPSADKRRAVLEAARLLFLERGFGSERLVRRLPLQQVMLVA